MKKYIFLLFTGFFFSAMQSQTIKDAMRYSQDNLNGTARYRAMSGAFGALGGDLSSLNVNPAGSAVFSYNQISTTLSHSNKKNNSTYFGTNTVEKENSFDLNQAGAVFVFKNENIKSDWKKFSLAINYENANNFDNSTFSVGINPTKSVADYFLYYANANALRGGIRLGALKNANYNNLSFDDQQAYLGYNAYIINPVDESDDNNSVYVSNVAPGGNYYQENTVNSSGYNGKLSFNAATSFKNKLYLGLNLNSHFTDYRQSSIFYEDNNNNLNSEYRVTKLQFNNDLYTYGNGFSFQIGAIAKLTNEVRLGLAYESPTWYRLYEEFSQKIVAISSNSGGSLNPDTVDPKIINVYDPYKLQTPGKLSTSIAYIFGKSGLISLDYSIKDYSNTKFKPESDPYFMDLNSEIKNTLHNTSEVRIGAEYKIEALSLRGGFRYEQSPYTNKSTIGDLKSYSGGIGYNFGGTKIDLSYAYSKRDTNQGFFSNGFTDGAKIENINNIVSLTLLFEL